MPQFKPSLLNLNTEDICDKLVTFRQTRFIDPML